MQVVVEAEAVPLECMIEGFFTGVAERGVPDIVGERKRFSELHIQTQGLCHGSRNLSHFEGVGQAAAYMIAGRVVDEAREYLGFSGKPPEGTGVKDARSIPRKFAAVRVRALCVLPARQLTASIDSDAGRKSAGDFLFSRCHPSSRSAAFRLLPIVSAAPQSAPPEAGLRVLTITMNAKTGVV